MRRSALLIGDFNLPEFRQAAECLRRDLRVVEAADCLTALGWLANGERIELILVALSERGRFAESQIRQIQAASPLARLCAVVGSWCEGETRSGHAWPAVERLYVHQLLPRAESEGWFENRSLQSLPSTASQEERWLHRTQLTVQSIPRLVVVCSAVATSRETMVEVCRAGGFKPVSTVPLSDSKGDAFAVIYDAHRDRRKRIREIRHLVRSFPDAGIVTLIEYPRFDEIQQIQDAGGHRVLGKPFDLGDLHASIHAAARLAKGLESAA